MTELSHSLLEPLWEDGELVVLPFGSSPILYSHPKLKAVDEQADDEIMDLNGF